MKPNETNMVVKPILNWLAANAWAVVTPQRATFRVWESIITNDASVRGVVWRQNTGAAMLKGAGGKLRPVAFGLPGMADIIGVMRGDKREGRWLAIECKRGGKMTPDQAAFASVIQAMGGLHILATCVEDVAEGLRKVGE